MDNIYGQHSRNIDAKNRVMLPTKIRDILGNNFFLTIGMEGIVELRSKADFQNLIDVFNAQSFFDPKARMLKRFWLGNSQEIELDSQNRFVIPKNILEKAAIQKEVLFIGVGNLVEMWSKEAYENYETKISDEELLEAAQTLIDKM